MLYYSISSFFVRISSQDYKTGHRQPWFINNQPPQKWNFKFSIVLNAAPAEAAAEKQENFYLFETAIELKRLVNILPKASLLQMTLAWFCSNAYRPQTPYAWFILLPLPHTAAACSCRMPLPHSIHLKKLKKFNFFASASCFLLYINEFIWNKQ